MTEPKQIFPVTLSTRAEVDRRPEPPSPDNAKGVRTVHIPGKVTDDVTDLRPRPAPKFEMEVKVESASGPKALRPAASSAIDSAFSFGNVESESGKPSEPTTTTHLHPSQLSEPPAAPVTAAKEDPTTNLEVELDMF